MNLYQSFENAMKAEKNVGTGFILLGILLLTIGAFTFTITTENRVVSGVKWSSLTIGILIGIAGLLYQNQTNANRKKLIETYQTDKIAFEKLETERANKLNKGYSQYRILWLALILISAGLIWFFNYNLLGGIGYILLLFTSLTVLIEAYSEIQTNKYISILKYCTVDK
jgi:hypothetical protein